MGAASVSVSHWSVGDGASDAPIRSVSTPVCPHGPMTNCVCPEAECTAKPWSRSNQPVKPDSVNGLPPSPVWIRSGAGLSLASP